MTTQRWTIVRNLDEVSKTQVFSGGACNIRDGQGNLLRNQERDEINDWLTRNKVNFYDPQIHPDTHGIDYQYDIHQPLEVAARQFAKINIFEISPRTFGGATSLEIAMDEFRQNDPTIIFFSDGSDGRDVIPAHSSDGYPLFVPFGVKDNADAQRSHYQELLKNAQRMRTYLMYFAQTLDALTISFDEKAYEGDIIITPTRVHAADMFRAVVRAAGGQRTIINFMGGDNARDEQGYQKFLAPPAPKQAEMRGYLDQYIDEGNALRRAIADLVRINVFNRVVYTQTAVIDALKDMLRIAKIRQDFVD
ncbi:MAG: hypothetical protein ACOYL5_02985 [Phototrophicaceae bacterium]